MAKLSEILKERGYVYQFSAEKLEEITDGKKRTVYLGIDPSADSLHVGNLQAMLVLRRFLEDGHKVILLVGGGTGMIGDPSGKSEERNLLDEQTIDANARAIEAQAKHLFGGLDFTLENNAKWLRKLELIPFLRDIGKHFSVNTMLQRDSVKGRIDREGEGISYTEFSYMLLQSYDFLHLHDVYGCDLQIGASDQWGNITSGIDLIRRKTGKTVYGLTSPLLINKATGKKFGKSESGAVWLDAEKTSPFSFYQFWFNVEDESVEEYLLKMTTVPKVEIDAVMIMQKRDKKERHAQRLLAHAVTELVHGKDAAEEAEKISQVLFGNADMSELDAHASHALKASAPSFGVTPGLAIVDVLIGSQLAGSKREARQFLADGAVSLNGNVLNEGFEFSEENFVHGVAILRRGKRNVCVLTLA
ncbi:MAG TPA: tyrosine--tRNA ligase [Candidatus Paceibacterota bacterium]|nr:tyrosine--tRNA ligase [Candidatus Paceibacterota bacterium]